MMHSLDRSLLPAFILLALILVTPSAHAQFDRDNYEPNDTISRAAPILTASRDDDTVRRTLSFLSLHHVDDVDFYRIDLPEGAHYDVTVSVRDAGIAGSDRSADVGISVYVQAEGEWSAVDDDEIAIIDDLGNTAVYIKVQPIVPGSIGTYDLVVDVVSRRNPSSVELPSDRALSVRPIPAADVLTVTGSDDLPITRCDLIDMVGAHVARVEPDGERHSVSFDLEGVAPGSYFVRVHTARGIETRPVVVAR